MKIFLLYLWQLPQNILGLIILLCLQGEQKHHFQNISFYYSKNFKGGISLGNYIILGHTYEKSIKHEFGHCIQSKKWGWLYLPVVGLCSIIWAGLYGTIIKETHNGYYKFWTEKNADKLGKVTRF
jgi:hypothetical protein